MPSIGTACSVKRIASTAAWSAASLSPRPTQRAAASAAASVTRTSSSARLRSGAVVSRRSCAMTLVSRSAIRGGGYGLEGARRPPGHPASADLADRAARDDHQRAQQADDTSRPRGSRTPGSCRPGRRSRCRGSGSRRSLPTIIVTSPGGHDSSWPRTTIHTRIQGASAPSTSRMSRIVEGLEAEQSAPGPQMSLLHVADVEPRQEQAQEQEQAAGRRDDVSLPEALEVHGRDHIR